MYLPTYLGTYCVYVTYVYCVLCLFYVFTGNNPGMGHRPLLIEEGALIAYKADNSTEVKKWVDNIEAFLARKFFYFIIYIILSNNEAQILELIRSSNTPCIDIWLGLLTKIISIRKKNGPACICSLQLLLGHILDKRGIKREGGGEGRERESASDAAVIASPYQGDDGGFDPRLLEISGIL